MMWMHVPGRPLETYQGFYEKRTIGFDRQEFDHGLRRIALGYFKKVFVVDFLFSIFFGKTVTTVGRRVRSGRRHWWWRWVCIIVFVRAYFDLSAYTDLAIGFAPFGFRIMENFHFPFWQEPQRLLAQLAHLAQHLVPQERLPGVRPHAQDVDGPVRQHAR